MVVPLQPLLGQDGHDQRPHGKVCVVSHFVSLSVVWFMYIAANGVDSIVNDYYSIAAFAGSRWT